MERAPSDGPAIWGGGSVTCCDRRDSRRPVHSPAGNSGSLASVHCMALMGNYVDHAKLGQ